MESAIRTIQFPSFKSCKTNDFPMNPLPPKTTQVLGFESWKRSALTAIDAIEEEEQSLLFLYFGAENVSGTVLRVGGGTPGARIFWTMEWGGIPQG